MGYLTEKEKQDVLDILAPEDTALSVINATYWEAISAHVGGSELVLWSSENDGRHEIHVSYGFQGKEDITITEDVRRHLIRELSKHIKLCENLRKTIKKSLKEVQPDE